MGDSNGRSHGWTRPARIDIFTALRTHFGALDRTTGSGCRTSRTFWDDEPVSPANLSVGIAQVPESCIELTPLHRNSISSTVHFELGAAHAVAAVVAEVAVAVADGDGAAVVAGGGVELEAGELLAPHGRAGGVHAQL